MQRPAPGLNLSDRFRLVRELGCGGMSSVWLAEDQQLGERVALKILSTELAASPDSMVLLREECRKVARLQHPNIVRVNDFYASDDTCFLSMQYIEGQTLSQRGSMPFSQVVDCVLSLCEAIEHAHRAGIVHRDIKTANVLCDATGHYYLTDFGIAGAMVGDVQAVRIRGGGSLPSMSPQQLDGEPATVSDDIYGLGALLYEVLSGAPLFYPQPTPQRVREEQPPAVTVDQSGSEIPDVLTALILAMLDKRPARRPAGIAAVRSVLEELRSDYPVTRTDSITGKTGETDEAVIQPRRRPASGGHPEELTVRNGGTTQPRRIHSQQRGLPPGVVLAGLGVLIAVAIGVVFLLPSIVAQRGPLVTEPDIEPVTGQPEQTGKIDTPATVDPAVVAAQRKRADEALGELLALEERLLSIGIENWGGDDWVEAGRLAETGNVAYRERDYVTALASHRRALVRMHLLESRAPEAFARALGDGEAALLARDQNTAIQQFEIALSIQPKQSEAEHGLQRALRLDRVLELMGKAGEAERMEDWQTAESFYRQALELDADWQPATEALGRGREAIARSGYETHMATGFSAVERQDYGRAQQAFRAALKIRPGDGAALEALNQVNADQELKEIVALRLAARAAETGERWAEVVRLYTEILAIDPKIEAINLDLQRARDRVQLDNDLVNAMGDTDRLYEDRVARQDSAVLASAQLVPEPGPRLAEQIKQLEKLLRLAATPVRVHFESDNLTDVVIYKVGRLGIFTTRTINLKPGVYVAVGARDGYRDVRRSFRVVADGAMEPIILKCEEPI